MFKNRVLRKVFENRVLRKVFENRVLGKCLRTGAEECLRTGC
jgi:hypothetical protein